MRIKPVDRMFLALADPNRRRMVEQLSTGPASVKQLAAPAGLRLPSAVKHLKVLKKGGIVSSKKVGRTRTFRMQASALTIIGEWVRSREAAWNTAFDRLVVAMQDIPEEDTEQ